MKNGSGRFNQIIETQLCSMCGAVRGDSWETQNTREILLNARPRYGDEPQFWVVCDECDEGLQNTALPKPNQINLVTQIRRATIKDQEAVLNWLLQKFKLEVQKKS